jgi:predicted amidohydrolase
MIQPYRAVCLQTNCYSASSQADIDRNLQRDLELIDWACDSLRPVKLIALPEFFLQGARVGAKRRTLEETLQIALHLPGPETEQLAAKARQHQTFIVGCAIEVDEKYPGVYFNTAFVISPAGEIALKYRKVFTFTLELTASPHDLLGQYEEDPFPVLDSEIGRIGCMVAYDAAFPEAARALALKGAEIIVRPSTWVGYGGRFSATPKWWQSLNEVRAFENSCYLVAPNKGYIFNSYTPEQSMVGHSMIVDFQGNVMARCETPGENACAATLDLEALRRFRQQVGASPLGEIRTEMIAPLYERSLYPAGSYLEKIPQRDSDLHELARQNIERLKREEFFK